MSDTDATSHALSGWLKEDAPLNIVSMSDTDETSHESSGWLNLDKS